MITGRRKIIRLVRLRSSLLKRNNAPRIGMSPSSGICCVVTLKVFWISPPSTMVLPSSTTSLVSSDRLVVMRSLETKVVVDDGNTIVLGGLIQNTLSVTTQQIPLLGDIPILGALFRFKSEERKRTNLMIFLRPVIIRSVEDGYRVTQ